MRDQHEENPTSAARWPQARPLASPVKARLLATLLLLVSAAVLALAAYLEPDPRGYGTADQLGNGPCGMLIMTGLPCPTCGMTTAFAHTVRGQWLRAFWVQPAGFVLALGTIGLAGVSLWTLIRGRWPRIRLRLVTPHRLFVGLLVLLLGAWAFKICTGLADGTLPYR